MARLLPPRYQTFDAWRAAMMLAATPESEARAELIDIDGIGPVVAEAIVDFVAEPHNGTVLDALEERLSIEPFDAPETDSPFAGKTLEGRHQKRG